MGRYYNGDINGKFWFATQLSDDAEQFGAVAGETSYIPYYADDLGVVKKRLFELFDEIQIEPVFYDMNDVEGEEKFYIAYNEYVKEHGRNDSHDSTWASLSLGLKLFHCIKEQGDCSFEAEI